MPPLDFRHTVQNAKRGGKGKPDAQVKSENKVVFIEPIVAAAPAKTRAKRKLSYSDNLVTFAVEPPRSKKKGKFDENYVERGGYNLQGGPTMWGHPSGASSSSDSQEGCVYTHRTQDTRANLTLGTR